MFVNMNAEKHKILCVLELQIVLSNCSGQMW